MMLRFLNSLIKGGADFYPFESRILEEVKTRLDAESGARLQRQIEMVNKIQRLAEGKEVNLYHMHHREPVFDDSLRFPNSTEEALLASASLTGPDKRAKLKVEVWLVKGHVFSLVFNKPPKEFFGGANLKTVQPGIVDMKIWLDPLRPSPVTSDAPVDVSTLSGWLRHWHANGWVTGLRAPLPDLDRVGFLERIDAQLPSDYLDLVAQTDGATLARCVVYGTAKIRKVVLPESTFYMLAEIEGRGALSVKEGDRDGTLYLLDYENQDARPIGKLLSKAIANLLNLEMGNP